MSGDLLLGSDVLLDDVYRCVKQSMSSVELQARPVDNDMLETALGHCWSFTTFRCYVLAWVFAAAFWGGYRVGDLLAEGGDAACVANSDVSVTRDLSYLTLRVRYEKSNASGVQLRVKRLDSVPGRPLVCPVAAWLTLLERESTSSIGDVECTGWLALWNCSTALPVLKKALPNLAPLAGFREIVTLYSLRRGFVALGLELGVSETDDAANGTPQLLSFRRYTIGGAGRTRVAIEYTARDAQVQRRSDPSGQPDVASA